MYRRDIRNYALIIEAVEEERILLSRDKLLTLKARKHGVKSLYVKGITIVEKLRHVSKAFNLKLIPTLSRCPKCNGVLKHIMKECTKEKVPAKSITAFDDFWRCVLCGSIFWKGSHWDNILETIDKTSNENCL
jgi:uncharacterized protein with PIN domain